MFCGLSLESYCRKHTEYQGEEEKKSFSPLSLHIEVLCTVSSSIDSREIPLGRFLPLYYSYSMPLREVRCFSENTVLLVAVYCSIELETV